MLFKTNKKRKAQDAIQNLKMEEGSRALMDAASATTLIANDVSTLLKGKLDDSIMRFERTSRILTDALFLCDMDGTIRHANNASLTTFGGELLDTSILNLFEENGQAVQSINDLWQNLNTIDKWEPLSQHLMRGKRLNGETFWLEPKIERLDWHNQTSSMLILARDKSSLIKLKEDVAANSENYSAIFESFFDAIIVVKNNQIVAANPSIYNLFGYDANTLLGGTMSKLFSVDEFNFISNIDTISNYHIRGIHESSQILDFILTMTNINWDDGVAKLIILKDISTMNKNNNEIKYNNSIDMTVCFDKNFFITFASQSFAQQFKMSNIEILGRDIRNFMNPDAKNLFLENLDKISPKVPSARVQSYFYGEDGKIYLQDWIDTAVFSVNNEVLEYQRIGRDIPAAFATLIENK